MPKLYGILDLLSEREEEFYESCYNCRQHGRLI